MTQLIYCKVGQSLIQSGAAATAKLGRYCKLGSLYYKMGQILESGADITK